MKRRIGLYETDSAMNMGRAFTVIELLVSASVVVVLGALLVPVLSDSVQMARNARCQSSPG